MEALGQVLRGETLVKLPPQRFLDLLTSMLHGSYADTEMFPFDPSPVAQGKSHVPVGVLKQWWGLHVDYVNIAAAVAFLETSFKEAESAVGENGLPPHSLPLRLQARGPGPGPSRDRAAVFAPCRRLDTRMVDGCEDCLGEGRGVVARHEGSDGRRKMRQAVD